MVQRNVSGPGLQPDGRSPSSAESPTLPPGARVQLPGEMESVVVAGSTPSRATGGSGMGSGVRGAATDGGPSQTPLARSSGSPRAMIDARPSHRRALLGMGVPDRGTAARYFDRRRGTKGGSWLPFDGERGVVA